MAIYIEEPVAIYIEKPLASRFQLSFSSSM